ncbi:helix-turn-helix transcriptional regulator [uncultured Enterovirga sp.]|uniref:helix-turn-helix transcriptional regulator n=1 Tax=uncultured Enterovirga sp. TaxID=2026352 RepID=UPI0035CBA7FA
MTEAANRLHLRQIIDGLSEGIILVEPDQTISYANPAALAMHGVGSLGELGPDIERFRQNYLLRYRNHRAVDLEEDILDRVIAGEAFHDLTVSVVRVTNPKQEWVHRVRSLVIRNRDGGQDCLALVIHDATDRYDAEERFERAFGANPAPALVCRLSDFKIVKVNEGFLHLSGYERDQVLGRSIYEIDVLREAERRDLAISRLSAGRAIPRMEACLRVPSDAEKWVMVAGQPISLPGDKPSMLFTFADLEDRRKAEQAFQQSQEWLAKSFQLVPVPTALARLDAFLFLRINDAFARTFRYTAEEVLGRNPTSLNLWVDPAVRASFEEELERFGCVRNFEGRLRTSDGTELDCLISAETVTMDGARCCLWAVQDVSERKRSETELVSAIESVMQDTSWFSRGVIEKLAALRNPPRSGRRSAGADQLTSRERDVLVRLCRGETDKQIGSDLGLAPNTVRNHVAALYKKIGVNRRVSAVNWARERGLHE